MHDAIASPEKPLHFPPEDHLQTTITMNDVIRHAKTATEKEHKMTLLQGIRLYPKAVAWSLLISTCICMEGYDVCLLSNFCESRQVKGLIILTWLAHSLALAMNQMLSHNSTRNMASNCPTGRIRYQHVGKLVSVT